MGESGAITVLAEATANRLRLLQRKLADERVEDRSAVLGQEVKDALSKVVPEQRREFLEELRTRFPSFDGGGMPAQAAESQPTDPLIMFDRLADKAASLSPAEKQAVVDRLREAGFPIGTGGARRTRSCWRLVGCFSWAPTSSRTTPDRSSFCSSWSISSRSSIRRRGAVGRRSPPTVKSGATPHFSA